MSIDSEIANATTGVLRKHKPSEQKKRSKVIQDDSESDEADQYANLEQFFRQKFAQEKHVEQDVEPEKRTRPRQSSNNSKTKKVQSDDAELVKIYKTLLDQTLRGATSLKQQSPAVKPLSEAQIRRNKEASEKMKAYHASKKAKTIEEKEVEVKQPQEQQIKCTPQEKLKTEVATEAVEKQPKVPSTMRNFLSDLNRRRR